ncbi:hypothetical protein BGZ82_001552 [Podila clonocystis]|nr:hypothetical protein BGZ82_001552 [Podila clonocystis]
MIHMVANNQNSAYNRMAFTLPDTTEVHPTNDAATTLLTSTELGSSSTKKTPEILIAVLPNDDDPSIPKGEQTNFNAWISSYLSGYLVNSQTNDNLKPQPSSVGQEQSSGVQPPLVKRDDLSNVPFAKSLIPTYLLNTGSAKPGDQPILNPHLQTHEDALRVEPLQTYSAGEVKAPDTTSASSESITIDTVDISLSPENSMSAHDPSSMPRFIQEELQPPSPQPQLNTAPALPVVLPLSSLEPQEKNASAQAKDSESGPIFIHSRDVPAGYNLVGVHLMLFIAANGFLIFLLTTLFLGVLIITEFVLDREDDDLVQLKWLYWGRVIGIATATIVSAVHGSFLSGYVLLDGQSDWIAKAAVGTILVYWVSMTWLMNRITGPLPY